MNSNSTTARPERARYRALIKQHEGRNYELHAAHVNPANVRTLKTIGFDRCYVRAEGPYLWIPRAPSTWTCSPAMASSGSGEIHPDVCRVLKDFLDLDYPSLVKLEAPLLSGLLAEQLKKRMPVKLGMVFFTNSARKASKPPSNTPAAPRASPPSSLREGLSRADLRLAFD